MSSFDNTERHLYLYDKNGNITQKLLLYDFELQYNFEFARHFYIHKDSIGVAVGNKFVYMTLAYTDIKSGLFKPNYSKKYTGDIKIPYKYKNKYIIAGTGTKGSHFIYEPLNHKKTFYNFYPPTKDSKKFNFMDYRGVAAMNESKGIYIYGSTKKNLLSFIKINDDFSMSLIRQINNTDYIALCGENKGENNIFYRNISISDDFLFVSYGQNISKESKSYIIKYDWSGDLKAIFCLNINVSSFAVDSLSQVIYIGHDNTLKYFKINAD